MVDSTTLILAATLTQTIVITLTLLVFIFQFRSQEKAIKESSYQNLMGRYNDFIMSQVDSPQFARLFLERTGRKATREDASLYGHLLIVYGIIEEAHLLYQKKWIDEETWLQWAEWLKAMAQDPRFGEVHNATRGMFDKKYEEFVAGIVNPKTGSGAS